jgi:hypothetical protein
VFGIFVVFSLIAAGSLVCLSAGIALRIAARKAQAESVAMGPGRAASQPAPVQVDPTMTFGYIIACYGVIALILVSALPGELALERTLLAYALLCVGGLIGEIAMTGTANRPQSLEALDTGEDVPAPRKPVSLGLSVALILLLNLAFSLLICAQGVIDIVPPAKSAAATRGSELDPIVVIAERTQDSFER